MGLLTLTDEQLLTRAAAGDARAAREAVERFAGLAVATGRGLYLPGADEQDLRQEALIGIWLAIRNWDPTRGTAAASFVTLCVRRQLFTAVKKHARAKAQILTRALRVAETEEGELCDAVDLAEQPGADPASIFEARDLLRTLARDVRERLSPLEARCLILQANGLSYQAIGRHTGATPKSIDNALQRAREKLAFGAPRRRHARPAADDVKEAA